MSERGYRIAVFDTETTGLPKRAMPLDVQPHIIELGVIICDQDYNVLGEYEWLVKPITQKGQHITITAEMTKHAGGITDSMVINQLPFAGIYTDLCAIFLGVEGIVAHNFHFDIQMLKFALMRINKQIAFPYPPTQICTMQSTRQYHPKNRNLSLEKLYKHLFDEENPTTHRALDDTRHLVDICRELKKRDVI